MSAIRTSHNKNDPIIEFAPAQQPAVAPKPKPKPRRIKSFPHFHSGPPDTEVKSLGTHLSFQRQKDLLSKQNSSPNHGKLCSQITFTSYMGQPEITGEIRSTGSPPPLPPPPPPPSPPSPPPASTIPCTLNETTDLHISPETERIPSPNTDCKRPEEEISKPQNTDPTSQKQASTKMPNGKVRRGRSLLNRRRSGPQIAPSVSLPIAISAPLLQPDSATEEHSDWEKRRSQLSSDSVFSQQDSVLEEDIEPPAESRVERKKQIAMELLQTEERYVERLELLNVKLRNVITCANNQHRDKPVVSELTVKQIFSNVHQIHQLNQTLLEELRKRLQSWENDPRLGDIMIRIAPFLKLYSDYVANFDIANSVLNDCLNKEKRFAALVQEFERDPACENLKVSHFMLEPVQRLTRYKLLFEDYLKRLPDEAPDRKQTESALKIISEAANHANSKIKHMENFNELLCIQRSLTEYSGELIQPHRLFIKRGSLGKVSRRSLQQRLFFLFSDVLLHTLPYGSFYKVRDEMELYSMSIGEPAVQPFPNSFNIFSVSRSLTVSASSLEEKEDWIRDLNSAISRIRENRDSRKKFSSSANPAGESSICEETNDKMSFGSKAPLWLPDSSVTMCQDCAEPFGMMRRRHHCRGCGQIICAGCSRQKVFLPYLNREDRVCNSCLARSKVAEMVADVKRTSDIQQLEDYGNNLETSVDAAQEEKEFADTLVDDTVYQGYVKIRIKWNFEKKWMLLKRDFNLYVFNAHEDIKPTHSLNLPNYQLTPAEDEKDKFKFKLTTECSGSPDSVASNEMVEIRPDNEDECNTWIKLITNAINKDLNMNS